jgi:hypothetical protein
LEVGQHSKQKLLYFPLFKESMAQCRICASDDVILDQTVKVCRPSAQYTVDWYDQYTHSISSLATVLTTSFLAIRPGLTVRYARMSLGMAGLSFGLETR